MESMELILWEATEWTTDEAIEALRGLKTDLPKHIVDHIAGTLCAVNCKAPIGTWTARAREVLGDLEMDNDELAEAIIEAFRNRAVPKSSFNFDPSLDLILYFLTVASCVRS